MQDELERSHEKEDKATQDNRQLTEKVSALEKEAASLTVELKAAQARYNQEVVAHQETERSRMLSKEEANLEVVKGTCFNYYIKVEDVFLIRCNSILQIHAGQKNEIFKDNIYDQRIHMDLNYLIVCVIVK